MSTFNLFRRMLEELDHDHEHGAQAFHQDVHEFGLDSRVGKPWKEVLFATFLINLSSLSGVILCAFSILGNRLGYGQRRTSVDMARVLDRLIIPSFAAGALLATSVFLIIPESIELLAGGHSDHEGGHDDRLRRVLEGDHDHDHDDALHDDHMGHEDHSGGHDDHSDSQGQVAWKFGVAIMVGYLLPFLLGSLFPHPHLPGDACDACSEHESLMANSKAANSLLHQAENNAEPCCNETSKCAGRNDRITATTASVATVEAANEIDVDTWIENKQAPIEEGKEMLDTPTPQREGGLFSLDDVTGWTASEDDKDTKLENNSHVCCENMECINIQDNQEAPEPKIYDYQLIGSILLGDAFHNFTDGLFVGNAFLLCDKRFAYAVAAATVYHEVAQEFADFSLLTRHCGLDVATALAVNFLSGLSVALGGFVILIVDVTNETMGIILSVSAGVYLYIAGTECLGRIQGHHENQSAKSRLIFTICFALGAVPIGLVLINHSHGCE